ncbi:NAD(P)-binding protein [Streptomyces sp. TG1A-60]|uniref:NAD(P)-binding protein n=1 Tax=Streptomyces sp. TG1A-60 TaxID=3129111 RepID=UPI0030CD58CD
MAHADVTVGGGGQAGLAVARTLRERGLQPVLLEASERAAGSWPRYYDSLTLLSRAGYSSLPSNSLRGVGRDAARAARHLAAHLRRH